MAHGLAAAHDKGINGTGIRPLLPERQFRDDGSGRVLTPFAVGHLDPLRISQHLSQEEFDLAVQAAQIVVCPARDTRPSAFSTPVEVPMNWVDRSMVMMERGGS